MTKTPQVAALPGMTPLGLKPTERIWSVTIMGPSTIRLLCNGVHLASINLKDDCGGKGWIVNPMSPNHPRSRKYWPTPQAAVRRTFGTNAANKVMEAYEHISDSEAAMEAMRRDIANATPWNF